MLRCFPRYHVEVVSERSRSVAGECFVDGNGRACEFAGLQPFAWYSVIVSASTHVGEVRAVACLSRFTVGLPACWPLPPTQCPSHCLPARRPFVDSTGPLQPSVANPHGRVQPKWPTSQRGTDG